jgi:hypothetical protein
MFLVFWNLERVALFSLGELRVLVSNTFEISLLVCYVGRQYHKHHV